MLSFAIIHLSYYLFSIYHLDARYIIQVINERDKVMTTIKEQEIFLTSYKEWNSSVKTN